MVVTKNLRHFKDSCSIFSEDIRYMYAYLCMHKKFQPIAYSMILSEISYTGFKGMVFPHYGTYSFMLGLASV